MTTVSKRRKSCCTDVNIPLQTAVACKAKLSTLLLAAGDDGVLTPSIQTTMRAAAKDRYTVARQESPYGGMVSDFQMDEHTIQYINPFALLYTVGLTSEAKVRSSFRNLMNSGTT